MKIKSFIPLLLLSVFFLSCPYRLQAVETRLASQEKEYLSKAKDYFNRGDLIRAKALFELALKENPNNEEAKRYLSEIEVAMAKGALASSSPQIEDLYTKAKSAFLRGDYEEAVRLFEEVLKYVPNHQYARRYLERARAKLERPVELSVAKQEEVADEELGITDPQLLTTKLKGALLALQNQLLDYFQTLSNIKAREDALLRKYLEEKERRVRELEERIRDQSALVDRLSAERLRLQSELARINEEIFLLERRLAVSFSTRTGEEVSWDKVLDLNAREEELTEEERRLREKLLQELKLRESLEEQLRQIEERLKSESLSQRGLAQEVETVMESSSPSTPVKGKTATVSGLERGPKTVEGAIKVPKKVDYRKVKRLLAKGKKELRRGNYRSAISYFSQVVDLDRLGGKYAREAEVLLAEARQRLKEEEARLRLEEEKKRKRLDLFFKAQDAYFSGDYDQAISLCEKILALDPGFKPAKELKKLALVDKDLKEKEGLSQEEGPSQFKSKVAGLEKEILPPLPDYSHRARESMARLEQEAKRRQREYIEGKLAEVKQLIDDGNLEKAEDLLVRLIRLYPEDREIAEYLSRVRKAKREKDFAEAVEKVNGYIENKEYLLAKEELDRLIRSYPEKKQDLLTLRKEISFLLAKPYLDRIQTLWEKGDAESLREALRIAVKARQEFPDESTFRDWLDKIRIRLKDVEKEERRLSQIHQWTLSQLEREIRERAKRLRTDPRLARAIDSAQEAYRREYYETALKMVSRYLDEGNLLSARNLLEALKNAPERYQSRVKRLFKELVRKERERDFYKHLELARSALKVYDFETARKELELAKAIAPSKKKEVQKLLEELDRRLKFYKVRQALKTAKVYLESGDFLSAKIVVKDILKNIDPKNEYAQEFLRQIEKAEALYYADLKLEKGIRALEAGDYESAVKLAKEGLKLDSKNRQLWELYRRAKARWQSEILRRKSLLRQIEEEASKRRKAYSALEEVRHQRLGYAQSARLIKADINSMLLQARRLMDEQRFDRAIALCQKILEYDPTNQSAKDLLDLILLMQEEIEKRRGNRKESASQEVSSSKEVEKRSPSEKVAKRPEAKEVELPTAKEEKGVVKTKAEKAPSATKVVRSTRTAQRKKERELIRERRRRERELRRLARLHDWTLKAQEREVKDKAEALRRQSEVLEKKLKRWLEEKAEEKKKEVISGLIASVKEAVEKGDYERALGLVKEVFKLDPDNRLARRWRRIAIKKRAQELERLAREKAERERKIAQARERTLKGLEEEVLARSAVMSRGLNQLEKALGRELWLLAKAQQEEEEEKKLESLERLLEVAEKDWSKFSALEEELARLSSFPLSRKARKRLSSLEKRAERLARRIEEEKAKRREWIDKKLSSLRLASNDKVAKDAQEKKKLISGMLEEAKKALYEGDYSRVLELAQKVADMDPDNKEAVRLVEKARDILEREKNLLNAQISTQDSTEDVRKLYDSAKQAYDEGDYFKARELFQKVCAKEKELKVSYYTPYAREYLDLIKEREKEIQELNRQKETEELKNRIVEKLYDDAESFEKAGKYKSAIAVYENILFLFPNDEKAKKRLFALKEKLYAQEKRELQEKLEEQDNKMVKEVMKNGIVPVEVKKKKKPHRRRLINLPPIKKKLQQKITAKFEDVSLIDVLRFFAKQTGVNIIPSASVLSQDYKVTIDITDMPLESALKYLLRSYNLTYQIDDDAVWITTPDQLEKEPMETKIYRLSKGIGLYSKFSDTSSGSVELGSGAQVSEVKSLKDVIQEAVDWPSGSKLVLDERSGTLIVTNTPANIKKIDEILWNLDITPVQVLIEAKFLEVDVNDLKELGVHWKIANEDWAVDARGSQFKHGVAKDSGFSYPDFTNASSGLNLTYKGVLTKPQFEAVLHALTQSQKTRTLSSPRVTTLNNQTATIKVVDEWIYPTRYEFQIVQFDLNGDGDYDDAGETRYENVPTDFVKRDVGIILRVTPSVGEDMKTISLSLLPEVSDAVADYFQYTGGVKLPKFTSRNLSTNVVVENTDTVVLGGLIKETRNKTLTKVPLLGDLPVLGNLFRKQSDVVNRRNLLIFVTASIIDPEGDALLTD